MDEVMKTKEKSKLGRNTIIFILKRKRDNLVRTDDGQRRGTIEMIFSGKPI
ncbi:Hypothetical protein FKW44_012953, partial [Caligus rogercresseyi]